MLARSVGSDDGPDAGTAAIDAMVALAMLSSTIALSIAAARQADIMGTRARETRAASALLSQKLDDAAQASPGVQDGVDGRFVWRSATFQTLTPGDTELTRLCTTTVTLTPAGTRRSYHGSTTGRCAHPEIPR